MLLGVYIVSVLLTNWDKIDDGKRESGSGDKLEVEIKVHDDEHDVL